ncbi:MAG: OmpH family outer membrane protein [Candidatus Omnitrophota bacterium]
MRSRIAILGLLFAGYFVLISLVPTAATAASSASNKVAYVDVAKVFDEYQKTQEQDKLLESKQNSKQSERDRIVDEIRKLKDGLELLSDRARQDKQDVIDEKIKKLQEFDRNVTADLKSERDKMARDILREIDTAIQDFGRKGNYTAIINDRVLLYADESADLTDDIINSLNEKYKKR